MGTAESRGTIVTTVVGDVIAPDVGEIEMSTSLSDVIDAVGSGLAPGRTVKAVFSGVANAVITTADLDVPLTYEGFQAIGSGIGSAGFIVDDDTACMVDAAYRFSRFLSIESCGQCPPCKLGSSAITEHLERIQTGTGTDHDLGEIARWVGTRHWKHGSTFSIDTGAPRCLPATEPTPTYDVDNGQVFVSTGDD